MQYTDEHKNSIYMETDSQQQITSSLCNTATKLSMQDIDKLETFRQRKQKPRPLSWDFDIKAVQRC